MDGRGKRLAIIVAVAMTAWFATTVYWAVRPHTDIVPVGVDVTLTPPRASTVEVQCNGPFHGAARDSRPLPTLNEQPEGTPPLAFQRPPCELVHHNARIVFAFDVAAYLAVIGGGAAALVITRRRLDAARTITESAAT